jgi:DNA invertase Pin-like site-specific DNA recombinase/polyhydroxyalkanoate synthesis regulator phasin
MEKNCIIYCRVSTATQAQQGESLDTQEKICRNIADTRQLKIVPDNKVFKEPFSGRADYRPIFDGEIMKYIKEHPGEVNYLIIRSIDRFTRGGSKSYEILKSQLREEGVELIDSAGIIQPTKNTLEHLGFGFDWSIYSPSNSAEIIMADYSNQEVRNLLTRTIGRQIELTQEGYHIGPAPDGFNIQHIRAANKKKSILIKDPRRYKYWSEIFAMRASGNYSDQEIVEKINAMGFKTKMYNKWDKMGEKILKTSGGNLLTIKKMQKDIQKPVYCGILVHKWTKYRPIKAKYEGLVSIEVFNQANRGKVFIKPLGDDEYEILYDYYPDKQTAKRAKHNPLFPYKFILCPECKKPFLGSSPKGKSGKKFPTYHCNRKHKYIGISKQEFEDNIKNFIQSLKFKSEMIKSFEATLMNKYKERQKELAHFSAKVSQNVSDLKLEQANLMDKLEITSSKIVIKKLEERIDALEEKIKTAQQQRNKVEITEYDISSFIKQAKKIMEHPAELLLNNDNPIKKQALFGLVFEETPTYKDILNGTPKLTPIFALSSTSDDVKSLNAPRSGLELNFQGVSDSF